MKNTFFDQFWHFWGFKKGAWGRNFKKNLIFRPNVSLLIVLDEKTGHFQNLTQKVVFSGRRFIDPYNL